MNTYRVPLLVDLFLYSHEADFIQGLVKKNEKELARSFNFTFRYIDFIDRSYPIEPEIKDTTDIARCTVTFNEYFIHGLRKKHEKKLAPYLT
jgi:hypothetical protein